MTKQKNLETVHFTAPIVKVDEEKRLVHGFATLNNIDKVGDIVTLEASEDAFANFRGNIREMHMPIAAGKMVEFRYQEYYDEKTAKLYDGIFVTAYVSKGAPDTWEKVLDGTLQGFSIGAYVDEDEWVFDEEAGTTLRIIKAYRLVELSLVDNPANDLANIFSIEKSDEGLVIKGMIADTKAENVFWCGENGTAVVSSADSADCKDCGQSMTNIGWFEKGEDEVAKVRGIIKAYASANEVTEGGGNLMTEKNEEVETKSEAVEEVTEEVTETEEKGEEAAETKTDEVVEEEATEEVADFDVEKAIGDLNAAVSALADTVKGIADANKETAEAVSGISEKFEAVNERIDSVTEKADGAAKAAEEATEKAEKVDDATAVKKSGELGGESETTTEKSGSVWGGAFLGVESL